MACSDNEQGIEYQGGKRNPLVGTWVAFEFAADSSGRIYEPYGLIISNDPNNPGHIILDKLYDSDVRIRAEYFEDSTFTTNGKTNQINPFGSKVYFIDSVRMEGFVSTSWFLGDIAYQLAFLAYEDMQFDRDDIEKFIYMDVWYYDQYGDPIDSVMIVGYPKTGFEEVSY